MPLICIDDPGIHIGIFPLHISSVIQMHMSVQEELRLLLDQKLRDAGKSAVGKILAVIDPEGRGVAYQDIYALSELQLHGQLPDPALHLGFRILIRSEIIAHAPAKPQDPKTPVLIDPVLDALTSVRRSIVIAAIMISMYIKHRNLRIGCKEGQILRCKISTGNNEIDPLQFRFFKEIPIVL